MRIMPDLSTLGVLPILLVGSQNPVVAQEVSASVCLDLAGVDLANTSITATEFVPAGRFVPPLGAWIPPGITFDGLPAFCRVGVTTSPVLGSEIKFEVWLPAEDWNGKFVGTGNGGFFGTIARHEMSDPLIKGYAVANTDAGHEGGPSDTSFALGSPEKLIDFGWRAIHEMTEKSKAIVAAYYGEHVRRSYWTGCSEGGREGLIEAQRFPGDYDAIFAGAPGHDLVPLAAQWVLIQQRLTDPNASLSVSKLPMLKEAAVSACDAADGVIDQVIEEPYTCSFDPVELRCAQGETQQCLMAQEIEAAREIYRGPVNPRTGEQIFPGPEPGSEPEWSSFLPSAYPLGENYFRDFIMRDPDWDIFTFDFDADVTRAVSLDPGELMATDPDLSGFINRGGKLLLWHGWTDGLISPQSSIDYYNDVIAAMGEDSINDSLRLLMAPGIDHCGGAAYTTGFDPLAVLDEWVEQGKAPDRVIAIRPTGDGTLRTRPLCAYPSVARYVGTGRTDDAESFECAAPTAH
jgi:feruloyl esterase